MTTNTPKRYIVCCGEHGRAVLYGTCDAEPVPGQSIRLRDARMILYWSIECGGLLGLAHRGPQTNTRLTHSVTVTGSRVVNDFIAVSDAAAQVFDAWPAA